jgi:hypothetical protein
MASLEVIPLNTNTQTIRILEASDVYGRHTRDGKVEIYVEAPPGVTWETWAKRADEVRRECTCSVHPVTGGLYPDPSKPSVAESDYVLLYDRAADVFLPYVSITRWTRSEFEGACTEAYSHSASCLLYKQKTGTSPNDSKIIYPDGGTSYISDLLGRVNHNGR